MTQPTDRPSINQLRNLADRTERGPLTGEEAARLRNGIDQLHQRIDTLEAVCQSNKQAYVGAVKHAWEVEEQAKRAEATLTAVRAELDRIATLPTVTYDDGRADTFPVGARWVIRMVRENALDKHAQTPKETT